MSDTCTQLTAACVVTWAAAQYRNRRHVATHERKCAKTHPTHNLDTNPAISNKKKPFSEGANGKGGSVICDLCAEG
jgi:hypothetical protein